MSIGKRIKSVRKQLGLSQTDFADKIGLKQAAIGLYENDQRGVADRTILLICEKYGVREEWLRTGEGEMFEEVDDTIISQLSDEYELDDFERIMIEGFLKMPPEGRKAIKSYVRTLVDAVLSEENYEEYREEYIKENAGPIAARHGDIGGLQEVVDLYEKAVHEQKNK